MVVRACCLVLVCAVSRSRGEVPHNKASCSENGDCGADGIVTYSLEQLREWVMSVIPPPINALVAVLVCLALYVATRMRDRTSLPWRLYQYRSKVFIVNQESGELVSNLRDVELLRMRLDEIERERDDLKAVLDNKRLTEKQSVVDLAVSDGGNQWEETVNKLQRSPPFACSTRSEYGYVGPVACSVHSNASSETTAANKKQGRGSKAPSLPSKDRACSHIPMPSRPAQVFSSADYARKCREMISKLNAADKRVAKLTAEVESTKKIREDFEVVVEQRNLMGRKISALTREKKEMAKQVITLQMDIKTVREQFDDVRKQHLALTRQFDQLNMNAKVMAKDKRLLIRQLGEAKEELVLARTKLDGIHLEKSRLVETIERMDLTQRVSLRSVQTQAPKSGTEVVRKGSNSQRMPFKNKPNNSKQKSIVNNSNEARKASQTLIKTPLRSKTTPAVAQNDTKIISPKSSEEVVHKLPKSLEDKCQEFAKQKSDAKDQSVVGKPSKSGSKTILKSTKGAISKKEKPENSALKNTKAPQREEQRGGDDKKEENKTQPPVATKPPKPHSVSSKSKKGKSAKELSTKSSIDITEFARSLQKLERNVEINMRVREEAARKQENKTVKELYHNDMHTWESRTQTATRATVSDTDTSGLSASRDEYTSESELDMVLGRSARSMHESTFSICCLDSLCSVCSASDCQLDHKSCSDVNCLATCSSCSLPVEMSQSIVSFDDDDDDDEEQDVVENFTPPPLEDADDSRQGLAAIFGNGPVGEGGPWNLPGLSGIMTRATRPTGSVLACQGSLGEVGEVTSSNELVDLELGEAPPPAEAAKKRVSCFTANEDSSKRTVNGSPAFRQFLQELATLVERNEAATGAAAAATEHNVVVDEAYSVEQTPTLEPLVHEVASTESQDVFEDSEDGVDTSYSGTSTATQYFVNNEREPIF